MNKYTSDRLEVIREAINLVINFIDDNTTIDKTGTEDGMWKFIVDMCGQNNILKLASRDILTLQNYIDESMEEE